MSIENKLELIKATKNNIRNKIIDKGVFVPENTPFKNYINYIDRIESKPINIIHEEWVPDPEWWDIETILNEDTNEGEYEYLNDYLKCIILLDNSSPTTSIYLSKEGNTSSIGYYAQAAKTSDGAIYTTTSSTQTITHAWDTNLDKLSSASDLKTRYVVLYVNPSYQDKIYPYNMSGLFNNALYIITEIKLEYSSGISELNKLLAVKCFKNSYIVGRPNNSAPSPIIATNARSYYFNATLATLPYAFIFENKTIEYYKVPKDGYTSINESTGLVTYTIGGYSNTREIQILDISEVDFTNHTPSIFTEGCIPKKVEGTINLENNNFSTSFTLFHTSYPTSGAATFSLNLPRNANVTLNVRNIDDATAKYLVENAPTIDEKHTLTIKKAVYSKLLNISHEYLPVYNGQCYANGIQVLTNKGWSITTT